MVRCAASPDKGQYGGYGQWFRYRLTHALYCYTAGAQTLLASSTAGTADQGPYFQIDAEGSSIRCILTSGGNPYTCGPVTDTTWTGNRGYGYYMSGRQSNAQPVCYYLEFTDINPVSGVPMPILMSGQVRSY